MHHQQSFESDPRVLRWGGLAGILGSVLFVLVFVIVGVFVGADPTEPAGAVMRFPDIRAGRTVENGLYLMVLVLWIIHLLALSRSLRGPGRAPALFGGAIGIVGLVVLAAGALPHAASLPISNLYHAPDATPADQATLALVWQGMQGVFNALLVTGLVVLPIGVTSLGAGMVESPDFGAGYGWASVGLGVVGLGAAAALLIDPLSSVAVVGVFALIVFHFAVGWKVYRLSRAPVQRVVDVPIPAQ
jgi:hypothetical protein